MAVILVVDDEEAIVELVAFNLKKEGFDVVTAGDGNEALQKISSSMPDLVVLDWMLPGIDGLEVCRRLRSSAHTSDLPIIMLTARGEEVDKILGLELGANDYVTKPFSPRELTARIRAHLRARRVQNGDKDESRVVQHGTLLLDADKYLVKKRGETVELSPKEFELLFLLASSPGRVFRREDILDRVWGYDYPADTRTVDVHVRYLRQKIEDDANNPALLLTVRGVGYKFSEVRT
jgi:two-component system, OmpR family, alkaline phosphatase synthesis response regulator PhoP